MKTASNAPLLIIIDSCVRHVTEQVPWLLQATAALQIPLLLYCEGQGEQLNIAGMYCPGF